MLALIFWHFGGAGKFDRALVGLGPSTLCRNWGGEGDPWRAGGERAARRGGAAAQQARLRDRRARAPLGPGAAVALAAVSRSPESEAVADLRPVQEIHGLRSCVLNICDRAGARVWHTRQNGHGSPNQVEWGQAGLTMLIPEGCNGGPRLRLQRAALCLFHRDILCLLECTTSRTPHIVRGAVPPLVIIAQGRLQLRASPHRRSLGSLYIIAGTAALPEALLVGIVGRGLTTCF